MPVEEGKRLGRSIRGVLNARKEEKRLRRSIRGVLNARKEEKRHRPVNKRGS